MFLDYLSLVILLMGLTLVFYTFVYIHDLPHKIAKQREHPHEEAIHVACWLSLFTLHTLWPLVFMWAVSHKKGEAARCRRFDRWGEARPGHPRWPNSRPGSRAWKPSNRPHTIPEASPWSNSSSAPTACSAGCSCSSSRWSRSTSTPSSPPWPAGSSSWCSCTSCCPSSTRSATTAGCTSPSARSSPTSAASSSRSRSRRTSRSRRGTCCSGSTRSRSRSRSIGCGRCWPQEQQVRPARRAAGRGRGGHQAGPRQPARVGVDVRPATPRVARAGQEPGLQVKERLDLAQAVVRPGQGV